MSQQGSPHNKVHIYPSNSVRSKYISCCQSRQLYAVLHANTYVTSCWASSTHTHTHTLLAYPLANLCEVSPAEALGHLGNVRKINVCSNRGLTEVGLEYGEA